MSRSGDRSEGRRPLQMMEQTISSITSAVTGLAGQYSRFTREFQLMVKAIGEARTKHEEERIVRHERRVLQEKLKQPDISPKHMKELLVRLVYCDMLGHDVSFGHIHALKFAQRHTLQEKRIGYLAVSLLLHENHELIILLINTVQKDLKSPNIMEISMALGVICKLIGSEMIPAVLPAVTSHLNHDKEIVKKKAVLALHHFYQCSPSSVSHLQHDFRRVLCDKDPGVMDACLNIFQDIARNDVREVKDLTSSFVAILKQVVEKKLPRDFDYHGVPAPWIQMKILRILALLGVDDLKCSECMYEVISLCMARADPGVNIGYAIIYECIRTVTAIYPNSTMIERCAKNVGRLLSSPSNNLKYLGINALTAIVAVSPKFAMEHQLVVIECLDDPDETLKRKTLELLCRMTNPSNIEVICDKLISYLRSTVDLYLRSDLVERITLLAERYAPDNEWFIRIMNSVFELGGEMVRNDVAQNLMRLVAEGSDGDDDDGNELRLYAVSSYLEFIDRPNLPDILVQVIAWVLGEYSYLSDDVTPQDVLNKLCTLLVREYNDPATRGWIVTATLKLVSQMGSYPIEAQETVDTFSSSFSFDLQQRCCEMKCLAADMKLMQDVMPIDASCEDLEVDESLSFLDGFVADALSRGAAPYQSVQPQLQRHQRGFKQTFAGLNFEPYAPPSKPAVLSTASLMPPVALSTMPSLSREQALSNDGCSDADSDEMRNMASGELTPKESRAFGLSGKTQRVWGKSGYLKKTPASPSMQHQQDHHRNNYNQESHGINQSQPTNAANEVAERSFEVRSRDETEGGEKDTRKHDLVSALFSGVGSSQSTYSGANKVSRQKPSTKLKKWSQSTEQPSSRVSRVEAAITDSSVPTGSQQQNDFLGIDFVDSNNQVTLQTMDSVTDVFDTSRLAQAEEKTAASQSSIDLLLDLQGLDLSNTVSLQPVPAAPNVMASIGTSSTVDMQNKTNERDESPLVGLPYTEKHDERRKSESSSVGFSFMAKTRSPSPPPSQTTAEFSLLDAAHASIGLPDDLKQFPCATTDNQDLCGDSALRLCCRKVYCLSDLTIVCFITNQRSMKLSNVTVQLELPANLEGTLSDGNSALRWEDDIDAFTTIRRILKLKGRQPGVNMSLRGQVSYRDATQQRLFFSLTIHINDLLRPKTSMNTDEFGHQWSSGHWYDKKLKITTKIQKPDQLMDKFKQRLNLHAIQIIGKEGVAAASFLQTNLLCLVHGKVLSGGQVELWIKTGNSMLTELVTKHCSTTF